MWTLHTHNVSFIASDFKVPAQVTFQISYFLMNSPIDIMSGLNFKTLSSEINKIQSSHYQTSATAQRLESVIVPDWRHAGFSKGVKRAWLTAGCNQVATASLSIVWSVETRARDWINVEDPTITFTITVLTVLTWSSRNPSQDEEMKRCEERKKEERCDWTEPTDFSCVLAAAVTQKISPQTVRNFLFCGDLPCLNAGIRPYWCRTWWQRLQPASCAHSLLAFCG